MISEEKMSHIIHLMLDGIEKAGMATFSNKDEAIRETRKVCNQYISGINSVGELARKRLLSLKNPPLEFSQQWDVLYHKYFEEEMRKRGG